MIIYDETKVRICKGVWCFEYGNYISKSIVEDWEQIS